MSSSQSVLFFFLYGPLIYIWWGLKFHFWVSIEKKNKNLPLSRRKFREISFRRSRSLAVQENTFTSFSLTTKKKLLLPYSIPTRNELGSFSKV